MEVMSFGAPELGLSNDGTFILEILDGRGNIAQIWSKMPANHDFFLTSPLFCKD